jgi:hypothetical protein
MGFMNTENGHKFNFNQDKCEYCGKIKEDYEDKNKLRCRGKKQRKFVTINFNKKLI